MPANEVGGTGPLIGAHSVVPAGQMPGDAVTPDLVGQGVENGPQPPSIGKLRRMFDQSRDLTNERNGRPRQELCRDYFDGPAQLNSEVRQTLRMRGQPAIYDNRIKFAINGVLGVLEAGKTDPRAFPRNRDDTDSADVATKTLRYIGDSTRWHQTKMDCAENYNIEGLCAAIFEWNGADVAPLQIRWEEFFYDPMSRRNDFKDAKYLGIAKWMYADDVRRMFPERYRELGDPLIGSLSGVEATWDDRPDNLKPWVDKSRNRMMVVEVYYQEQGEWFRCVYCAAGWLDFGKSAYLNPVTKETRCPIEAQSYYVDRCNNRYSPIVDMMPMQDEVNARRSRGLHLTNSRQVQQTDMNAPTVDIDTVRAEASKADGVLPMGYESIPVNDMAAGNLAMLAEAKESLARMAPTPAVLQRQEGVSQSGRARLVAQQAGLTELGRGFSRFSDWDERCYQQMWMCGQQFYTAPKWIRITDDPKAPEFIRINEPVFDDAGQPVLATDPRTGMPVMQPMVGPDGQPVLDPNTGQPAMQPVQEVRNRIVEMDMDIIIDVVPDTANLQQEVYESFVELVRGGLDPFSPQFEILIEMSPIQDKAAVLEKLKAKRDELQQAQAQAAQQAAQVAQQQAQGEAANDQAQALQRAASADESTARAEQIRMETQAVPFNLALEVARQDDIDQSPREE